MIENTVPIKNIAPLRNVSALLALVRRVQERSFSLPGMATFHGPSGYGKSSALVYTTLKTGAVAIQAKSIWKTPTPLCQAILAELGQKPEATISRMYEQIVDQLARTGAPLIIDEADHLMKNSMIEIIRDIYEGSNVPVILIGEEQMPQKLTKWERVHNRMLDWVGAEPSDLQDTAYLADIYAPGVTIGEDLLAHILDISDGNARRICVNLERTREVALTEGLECIGIAEFGERGLFTGAAPMPRKRIFGRGVA